MFDLSENARGVRISSNIIIISVFANLFLGISKHLILMLEIQLVLYRVDPTTLFNFPGMFSEVEITNEEAGPKLLLVALFAGLDPWLTG